MAVVRDQGWCVRLLNSGGVIFEIIRHHYKLLTQFYYSYLQMALSLISDISNMNCQQILVIINRKIKS